MDSQSTTTTSSYGIWIIVIIIIIIIIIVIIVWLFWGSGQRFVVHPISWIITIGTSGAGTFIANSNSIYIQPSGANVSTVTVNPGTPNLITINSNDSLTQFGAGSLFILDNTKSSNTLTIASGSGFTPGTGTITSSLVIAPGTSAMFIWDTITSFHRLN